MNYPSNPTEFRCMAMKVIDEMARIDPGLDKAAFVESLEEVIGAMVDSHINGRSPSASITIMGRWFTNLIMAAVERNSFRYNLLDANTDSVV